MTDNKPLVSRWIAQVEEQTLKTVGEVFTYANEHGQRVFERVQLYDGKKLTYQYAKVDYETDRLKELRPKRFADVALFPVYAFDRISTAIRNGAPVFYVQNEESVRQIEAVDPDYCAVTAGEWTKKHTDLFAGANVVIFATNTEPAKKDAIRARNDIAPVASSVKLIVPCKEKRGGDILTFFEDGHTYEDFINLIKNASPIDPDAVQINASSGNGDEDFLQSGNYDRFHKLRYDGKPEGVNDFEIKEDIINAVDMFVLNETKVPYIYNHGVYDTARADTRIMQMVDDRIVPSLRTQPTRKRIFDYCLHEDKVQKTYTEINQYSDFYINFKNGIYDAEHHCMLPHDPKYFAINQLQYAYDPDATPAGDFFDRWFAESVPDPDDREMILQYCGYCMTKGTRQQKMLILTGDGGTGKSKIIDLLTKVIGDQNTSAVELEDLNERFATYGMIGKLLNACADLDAQDITRSATFKKLTGEDMIRAEKKGKDAITVKPYAKLLFSLNNIPDIRDERSNGFFRRVLTVRFDNVPVQKDTRLDEKLSADIDHFIHLCVNALERMIENNYTIFESRNSKDAVNQMRIDSDVVEAWLQSGRVIRGDKLMIERGKAYEDFKEYCIDEERIYLQNKGFFKAMRSKHVTEKKSNGKNYLCGIGFPSEDGSFGIEE